MIRFARRLNAVLSLMIAFARPTRAVGRERFSVVVFDGSRCDVDAELRAQAWHGQFLRSLQAVDAAELQSAYFNPHC
jgi:hypothetical protein